MTASQITLKLWNYCDVLLDDGVSYGDYVSYDDLIARDKVNLDITWLRDESLEDGSNLPAPDILAQEIADDLRSALEEFEALAADLSAPQAG